MVADRLGKMRHLIPSNDTVDAKATAQLYLRHVWKHHGLPKRIVSDRGKQFTADFWQALNGFLEIGNHYSTAYHPQTDGQSERFNAVMEQYLQAYVYYKQDNWVTYLPMAEFAVNNQFSETIKATPFMANYGFLPRFTIDLQPQATSKVIFDATATAARLSEIQDWLKAEITYSQERQAEYANNSRLTAPRFQQGDKVWLSSRHITTKQPLCKLDHKRLGPFDIIKPIGSLA